MIPLATTTITVRRRATDEETDPYDAPAEPAVVVSGVRARIGRPSLREQVAGGTQSVAGLHVWCDPFDGALLASDQIVDDVTGDVYELDGPGFHQRGFGLDHFEAPIKQIVGVA